MRTVPQTDGIRSKMVTPFLQEISGLRNNGEFFAAQVVSRTRNTQSTKGSWFPFASRSLEAPGRERPQPTPDHTGDLHDRCLTWTVTLNSGCSSLHITRRRLLLHRESLLLMLSHLALIQQRLRRFLSRQS